MHLLRALYGLILQLALYNWGNFGAHCPKMVRGNGKSDEDK